MTFDPLRSKAKGGTSVIEKDHREILWLIRKKRPKLVIGYGYHEQIRRGAWFVHDHSGNALQLSLPCMIRLECGHDVFHARGNARDRRDGERVSILAHILPEKVGRRQSS